MPQVDELRRRAREAESAGDFRAALERYREALDAQRRQGDQDGRETGLLLRIGDLHARLDDRRPALEAYYEASERYARQGLVPNAIAVCSKILRLYPEETRACRLLAEHQLEMGLAADARSSLLRGLEAARAHEVEPERDGAAGPREPGDEGRAEGEAVAGGEAEAVEDAARRWLRREADQEVCLGLAALLRHQGRTDEAVELLRRVWEERTGLRKPAGAIEARARKIDPSVDFAAWTPMWPPSPAVPGEEAAGARDRPESGGGVEAGGRTPEATRGRGDEAPATGTVPTGEGGPAARPTESAGLAAGDEGGEEERHFVRRYEGRDRSPRRSGGGEPEAGAPVRLRTAASGASEAGEDAPPGGWTGNGGGGTEAAERGRAAPRDDTGPSPTSAGRPAAEAGRAEELARGLEVLEELIELAPSDLGLRRRKAAYARRMGDPELLGDALLGLADALAEAGHRRGAWLVYEGVLERLRPGSGRAGSGLEALRAEDPACEPSPPGALPADEARPAGRRDPDADFRRRLTAALRDVPRALTHLHAAAEAVAALGADETVPAVAHLRLARHLLLRDRPAEAVQHLETALDRGARGEEAADALFHLGRALSRSGDREAASARFRELAEIDRGVAVARSVLSAEAGPEA